jgi:hypothetical protein
MVPGCKRENYDILRYLAVNNSEVTFFRKPTSSQLAERSVGLFSNGKEGFVRDSASLLVLVDLLFLDIVGLFYFT